MRSWKDALEQISRRVVLLCLSGDNDKNPIKLKDLESSIVASFNDYLSANSDRENLDKTTYHKHLQACFRPFRSIFREDATKLSDKVLHDPNARVNLTDFFLVNPEHLPKDDIAENQFFAEFLGIMGQFPSLKSYFGTYEIKGFKHGEIEGDFHLATPFYLLSSEDDNFIGFNDLLSKEQVKVNGFLKTQVRATMDLALEYEIHKAKDVEKEKELKRIEVNNRSVLLRHVITVLSNLLWQLIYPLGKKGDLLTSSERLSGFNDAISFFSLLEKEFANRRHRKVHFIDDMQRFCAQAKNVLEGLSGVYEREQISKLSLSEMAIAYQDLSRTLCENIFEFIYGKAYFSGALAHDLKHLGEHLKKDTKILEVFDKRPKHKINALANPKTKTLFDILIVFTNATFIERKHWLDALNKKSSSDYAKQFSSALSAFKSRYVNIIKEKMAAIVGANIFNAKRDEVANMASQRVLPLCVIAMNEYALKDIDDTPTPFIPDNFQDEFQQLKEIEDDFLSDEAGVYHVDLLQFFSSENRELLKNVKILASMHHKCHNLSQFLLFVNEILDDNKVYFNYVDFRKVFSKLFAETYLKAHEINEFVLSYSRLLEADNRLTLELTESMSKTVKQIRQNYDEFQSYCQELHDLPNCPYPNEERARHVQLVIERLLRKFKNLFKEEIILDDVAQDLSQTFVQSRHVMVKAPLTPFQKNTSQMMQVSKLIGGCLGAMTFLSRSGYKGGYLNQLEKLLQSPPFNEQKVKSVVLELARIVCSYRKGWLLGFHRNYAHCHSSHVLVDAILNTTRQYTELPLADWLFGETVALEIEHAKNPRARIRQALVVLAQTKGWAEEDKYLALPGLSQSNFDDFAESISDEDSLASVSSDMTNSSMRTA